MCSHAKETFAFCPQAQGEFGPAVHRVECCPTSYERAWLLLWGFSILPPFKLPLSFKPCLSEKGFDDINMSFSKIALQRARTPQEACSSILKEGPKSSGGEGGRSVLISRKHLIPCRMFSSHPKLVCMVLYEKRSQLN